jgi:hypothetical protein
MGDRGVVRRYVTREPQGPVLTSDSRYEQLCDALVQARAERVARRDECFAFIERLVQGLIDHLAIPSDLMRLAPPIGVPGDDPLTVGAASTLGEDGYWQTGLHLTIGGQAFGSPSLVVALVLHVKKKDGVFLFKLAPDGPTLKISEEPDADASEAHDFIFQQLLDSLRIPG